MTTFHRRPQFQAPIYKLPSARAAEKEDDQMPTENLGELLGRVSKNSTGEIDSLIGDFARLREKLQTDGEHIQREVEEYRALSEQVMQLTKTISERLGESSIINGSAHDGASGIKNEGRLALCAVCHEWLVTCDRFSRADFQCTISDACHRTLHGREIAFTY